MATRAALIVRRETCRSPQRSFNGAKGGRSRDAIDFVIRNRIHLLPAAALITWAAPPLYGSTPSWHALPSILLAALGIYQLNRVCDSVEDEINDPDAYAKTSAAATILRTVAIGAISASIALSIVLTNYAATAALSLLLLAACSTRFHSCDEGGTGSG
jgi:hypothetical protein